jgi:hypothetical protein
VFRIECERAWERVRLVVKVVERAERDVIDWEERSV